ncbi:ewing's tumor-associated antigen 1 homolog [Myripristis murdjan]|uniref:ETAA1 activator of ATR kinase b n=1 Tax=Myripristis murdjan TaxID=586833 RepID=A0A667X9Z0_9TELE|nr:ewing's tumor-associated antigen 1 [Myripristis murdjan]
MSEQGTHDAHCGFSEVWRSVTKLSHNALQESRAGQQASATTAQTYKDLQSPKRIPCSRYPGLNNVDSPGDGEPSQDIIWDPTSPPHADGRGLRNTIVVEISDIVNRIAPKDAKPAGVESPLLQWIGDSAVPCTPEVPQPRVRKKSTRQSNVEDLMKLARQFDKNMQEDSETSEQLNTINTNVSECGNTSETKPAEKTSPSFVNELKSSSTSDQVEAELHALFDSSTQKVSGRLSQGSSVSACSQELKGQPQTSTTGQPQQSVVKSTNKPDLSAHLATNKENKCDEFDDDWENDDLLNDSFVLAMTQNPDPQHGTLPEITLETNTRLNTTEKTSKSTVNVQSSYACQTSRLLLKPSCSALQELCPKPKTSSRSTFKLEPNPLFQAKVATARDVSKPNPTAVQSSKSQTSDRKYATTKPASFKEVSPPQPHKITSGQVVKSASVAADISDTNMKTLFNSDCMWDDGNDDELLYQVCDNVERISSSQPEQTTPTDSKEKQDIAGDRHLKTTVPLPIEIPSSISTNTSTTNRQTHAFVRSNSLPGMNCETENNQGWNIPMKGTASKPQMSQSLPGSRVGLSTFSQFGDSSGSFQATNANVDTPTRTVTARPPQNSKSHHASFKRNLSDSVALSSKVFVTSQMTGKCSAAEIERKKQEALARRRQRMQNTPKP